MGHSKSSKRKSKHKKKKHKSKGNQGAATWHTFDKLILLVAEARDLAVMDSRTSSADPYVIAKYGQQQAKTESISKTLKPAWQETFEFFYEPNADQELVLAMWDKDMLRDQFMGQVVFNLKTLTLGQGVKKWHTLKGKNNEKDPEVHGDIKIGVKLDGGTASVPNDANEGSEEVEAAKSSKKKKRRRSSMQNSEAQPSEEDEEEEHGGDTEGKHKKRSRKRRSHPAELRESEPREAESEREHVSVSERRNHDSEPRGHHNDSEGPPGFNEWYAPAPQAHDDHATASSHHARPVEEDHHHLQHESSAHHHSSHRESPSAHDRDHDLPAKRSGHKSKGRRSPSPERSDHGHEEDDRRSRKNRRKRRRSRGRSSDEELSDPEYWPDNKKFERELALLKCSMTRDIMRMRDERHYRERAYA